MSSRANLRESQKRRLRDWYDSSGTWVMKMTALYDLVEAMVIDAKAAGWDACVAQIRKCDPKCTDDCDLCAFRGDVIADIDRNPFRDSEENR